VLYVGKYEGRLQWILFFFVFGAVLIARISMQSEIANRAGLYGFILGGLVWLALLLYVDYHDSGPLASFGWAINALLIAIIWWCAHRLTWDCTLIDDAVDASGAGLLEAAGLEKPSGAADESTPVEVPKRKKEPHPLLAWWDRYQDFRDKRLKRPHTPGVWVVYFSLAALPLFGLGQALIPETDGKRRAYSFLLMVVYVSSGLGLLLATSFLGLRRYLRQRGLRMPRSLAGVWVLVGGVMIAALLVGGSFLPRPDGDAPWLEWAGLQSGQRNASRLDVKGGRAGEGKGRRSGRGSKQGKGDGSTQGEQGDKSDQQGRGRRAGQRQKGEGGGKKEQSEEGGGKGGKGKGEDQGQGRDEDNKDPGEDDEGRDRAGGEEDQSSDIRREFVPPETGVKNAISSAIENVSPVVKWVLYVVLGLAAAYVLFRVGWAWLKYLANFTYWARRLLAALQAIWQDLLAWWYGRPAAERAGAGMDDLPVRRSFADFRDPFLDGSAEWRSPEELIRYSFEALQAWAVERDLGRQPGETPFEFAGRLGTEFAALEADARRLVNLYARAAYARGSLPAGCQEVLRQFWQQLTDVSERPLSAGVAGGSGEGVL
jgi:hypothetical protein